MEEKKSTVFFKIKPVIIATLAVWILSSIAPAFEAIRVFSFETGVGIIAVFAIALIYVWYVKKDRNPEKIVYIILLGTLVFRAYFALVSVYNNTTHDTGMFSHDGEIVSDGHFGYIEFIFFNWRMPNFDPTSEWGFYNPPGFYILSAIVLKITSMFQYNDPFCYEALQSVPFFFSAMSFVVIEKIIDEFKINSRYKMFILVFMSIHPFFYITGSIITNDAMAMFFAFLSFYLTIRWYKNQTFKGIILIALSIGMATFTKINAGMMAIGIAFVFGYALFTNLKEIKKYILQFLSFIVISAPLGLYNSVRNYINYGVSFFYAQPVNQVNANNVENASIIQRLLLAPVAELTHPFIDTTKKYDVNVWVEMIRTSLFDENFSSEPTNTGLAALVLFVLAVVISLVTFVVLIKVIITNKTMEKWLKIFVGISYFPMLIGYAWFCIKYPVKCSMNYRYISTALLFPMLCTGVSLTDAEEKGTYVGARKIVRPVIVLFFILSLIVIIWLALFSEIAQVIEAVPLG